MKLNRLYVHYLLGTQPGYSAMGRTLYPTCAKGLGNIQAIRFAAQRTIPQNLAQITLDRAPDVEAKSMLLKPIRGIMIHGILIRWQDTQRFKVVCFNLGVFYFDEC